ncbi:MAG: RNA polymerase sigma factor [Sediminibacterium magnilacihabitans]|jgi:RNA polymerase sigma factor (sigma-70 family)|nr:RNA polymerase sigma factor [Sediminibacterium magnilacihabitans]PQV62155.1 RNA polymerase sigma factor (sigma-70 family) [Sediminibacterium magnilacihabitans]
MEENELIKSCLDGNKQSLEKLISSIQGLVFNLSLRFLWNRLDAEDATQEILIKIITNLSKYDGRSKFSTWAYRVATNYLINLKQTALEKTFTSFDIFSADLESTKELKSYDLPDKDLLEKEMKTGCTLAMLQCLDRNLRIAFILGSILKIKSNIASSITGTTPENFRKRLELSRKLIGGFLNSHCGIYNPHNSCRCNKRINSAISCGRIKPANLYFADKIEVYNNEMEELNSLTGIYQNHGNFKSETNFIEQLTELIRTKKIINYN